MRKPTKSNNSDLHELAEDARALMVATANVAGHRVDRARKRLAVALERGRSAGESLMDTSAEMAGEKIGEVRERLDDALDRVKELYDEAHDDVVARAKSADHTVRENPYQAMGIALGVGALVGYILSHRCSRNSG